MTLYWRPDPAFFISKEKQIKVKEGFLVHAVWISPRVHAKNIASLAAETHSWDIFLSTPILRMTGLIVRRRQLGMGCTANLYPNSVLDINVLESDVWFVVKDRITMQDNHYNGTVWRIGKGLAESKIRLLFETRALRILKDNTLNI